MAPSVVATLLPFCRRRRLHRVAVQPLLDDVMIKLFAPQHAGERLALNGTVFLTQRWRRELRIKFISFVVSLLKDVVEVRERIVATFLACRAGASRRRVADARQSQPNGNVFAWR